MMLLSRYAMCAAVVAFWLGACSERNAGSPTARQTKFPGQVSAGGGTSGEILARNSRPATAGDTTGGTPFIAGGAGGTTGGTATTGTVQETGTGPTGKQPPPDQNPKAPQSK